MRQVAFLRAVNVGGRTVKMDVLKRSCEALALANVATFIASGNVIFDSTLSPAALETAIEARLRSDFGFDIGTMIRSIADLRAVQDHVGRAQLAGERGVTLYVGFLKAAPGKPGIKALASLSNDIDRLSVQGRQLYWQAARGLAESTLSGAKLEKVLGTPATLRNINTIDRILAKFGNG